MQLSYSAAWWIERPSYVKASGIHRSLLFLLGLPFHLRHAGSRAPRGLMSRKTGFLAQTPCSIRERQFCCLGLCGSHIKGWFASSSCSPRGSCMIGRVQQENTKSKDSGVTSRVLLITLTRTVARLNKQAFNVRRGTVWNPKLGVVLSIQWVFSTSTNAVWLLPLLQTGAASQNASCLLSSLLLAWAFVSL